MIIMIYSITNMRGEVYVGQTTDMEHSMKHHKSEMYAGSNAQDFLGSDNMDQWNVSLHDVFEGESRPSDSNEKLQYWITLIGGVNSSITSTKPSITGNDRIT